MISVIILGLMFCYIQYRSYHYDNIFQIPIYILLAAIWTFILAKKYKFRDNNGLPKTDIKIAALFSIVINVAVLTYYEVKRNTPTLMKAEIFGGYADFKKNGQYVIVSGSWASRKHFYGNYEYKDSMIITDRKTFDDIITTNKFLIKSIPNGLDNCSYMIQIDDHGKEINREYSQNNFRLKIVEDNRLNGR